MLSRPSAINRIIFAFLTLFFAGCGSGSDSFVYTNANTNASVTPVTTRSVVVQSVLARTARTVTSGVATLTFSAVDGNGAVVFGPVDKAPQISLRFDVPLTAREFRIAYRDSGGKVVGVYQASLPTGTDTFTITDPAFLDLNDFVANLTVNQNSLALDVSQSKTLSVTAHFIGGGTADVGALASLSSSAPSVASTSGAQVTGSGVGSAVITVTLFDKQTTVSVTVSHFVVGLLSTAGGSTPGNGSSRNISISDDGRYAAFESSADNLGDQNGNTEVLLVDRSNGALKTLSNRSDGSVPTGNSDGCRISGNGRCVVFESRSDLVPEDTNGVSDVYLYDIQTSTLELVSVNSAGTAAGNAQSEGYRVSVSRDGRFVAFHSDATDLVTGDSNGRRDVFLRDRQAGTTELISQATDGTQANGISSVYLGEISDNGRYVVFYSSASNLDAAVTDTNGKSDAFLRDRVAGTTTLISKAFGTATSGNDQTYPTFLSADGNTVVLASNATNLTATTVSAGGQLYRYTRSTGTIELLTDDNSGGVLSGKNVEGSLSADGRFLLFSNSNNSVFDPQGRVQVIVRDLNTGEYKVLSAAAGGVGGNGNSFTYDAAITQNGRTIVFESKATDLTVQAVSGGENQVFATVNPFLQN